MQLEAVGFLFGGLFSVFHLEQGQFIEGRTNHFVGKSVDAQVDSNRNTALVETHKEIHETGAVFRLDGIEVDLDVVGLAFGTLIPAVHVHDFFNLVVQVLLHRLEVFHAGRALGLGTLFDEGVEDLLEVVESVFLGDPIFLWL